MTPRQHCYGFVLLRPARAAPPRPAEILIGLALAAGIVVILAPVLARLGAGG